MEVNIKGTEYIGIGGIKDVVLNMGKQTEACDKYT